ncbi:Ankyrin repeat domain-containing protein 56 [Heterocephalus glaber]|uniref:Ankyrin repeat domain-containing protein 56 n=1 Tax=Heterocephalus glaber TaxID=10181 RepID=G5BJQ2_HETGA|nr:ankyrin repeat domain-containing protein SOWAHB [Heterocephalus glaber]EHB09513.1 Ankyrin repeat domain-containing protein 56 [Heterocephalus glaber]
MARELSQEALLDFLCQAGGRVTNAALLSHFKSFLRDPAAPPDLRERRRELFKGFVNSVAAVRQDPDGTKCVVLRRRYRDLVGEGPGQVAPPGPRWRGARPDSAPARDQPGTPSPETQHLQRHHPTPSVQDRPHLGTPSPDLPHQQRHHPAPPTLHRPEPVTSGTPHPETSRPETSHLQRHHSAPPARDRPEPVTPGTPSPETPHLQCDRPAPPTRDRPEPVTSGTPYSETPHPQCHHPSLPALDRREPETPSTPHPQTVHSQLRRTEEWVARHQQMPEPQDQGLVRAWSVLPHDFLQLRSEPGFCVRETAPSELPLSSRGLFLEVPDYSSESWLRKPPTTVFRSIRCQLSLQDMDDFVDQESHGSEESSSGPKESPGGSEEGLQGAPGVPDLGEPRNPARGLSVSPKEGIASLGPQDLRGASQPSKQAPTGVKEPLPWPAPPKARRSLRRSPRAGKSTLSSSDEECLDEDLLKRTRCPPRLRKPSKAGAVPSPTVAAALTPKLAGIKAAVAETGWPHSWWVPSGEGAAALVPHRAFEHKSSLVPLEAREHDWIVKLASGSWIQVLALFWEDPQLALHRDFLTGYTALHWIAKHGSLRALQDLVSGAGKAGIVLDVNVRSSCGYTPLHLAAIHGHQGIIKLLVQRLASRVNVRDSSGKKPWQYLASDTSGEIWQLLGAPRAKPIFPVHSLVQNSSPTRKTKTREISRHVTRKTSLAALLKSQHNKWKLANHHEKFPSLREREEYSE